RGALPHRVPRVVPGGGHASWRPGPDGITGPSSHQPGSPGPGDGSFRRCIMPPFTNGYRGADRRTFTDLGRVNRGWGVCGFTSSVYAMYATRPGERALLINATRHFKVLATIKSFLTLLRAGGETELLREIELFNRYFGDPHFTLEEYVQHHINEAEITEGFARSDKYRLAMTPNGVARFLETQGFRAKVRRMKDSILPDLGGDAIIGVKEVKGVDPNKPMYDGLCHWMYRHGGKIYSWGRE